MRDWISDHQYWVLGAVVLIVLFFQTKSFLKSQILLKGCKKIFPDRSFDCVQNETGTSVIGEQMGYPVFNEIVRKTNSYISRNRASVELRTMEDIAELGIDTEFESATSRISFPMYIGLLGTFLGVGLGLGMLIVSDALNFNAVETSKMEVEIEPFILGVAIAMATSFYGLILTIANNNLASKVEKHLQACKGKYFSFLQTEVLSLLPSNINETLGALNETIHSLTYELASTFSGITEKFGQSIESSLSRIQSTVSVLGENVDNITESIRLQKETIVYMRSKAFTTALDKITETVDACIEREEAVEASVGILEKAWADMVENQDRTIQMQNRILASHHKQLEVQDAFNVKMAVPERILENVTAILDRFGSFETSITKFAEAEISQNTGMLQRIDDQIRELSKVGGYIQNYLNKSDEALRENLDKSLSEIREKGDQFVYSWKALFTRLLADETDNPLAYFQSLQYLNEKIEVLTAAVQGLPVGTTNEEVKEIKSLLGELKELQKSTQKELRTGFVPPARKPFYPSQAVNTAEPPKKELTPRPPTEIRTVNKKTPAGEKSAGNDVLAVISSKDSHEYVPEKTGDSQSKKGIWRRINPFSRKKENK